MTVEIHSLDPRVNRLSLHTHEQGVPDTLLPHDHWGTFQVFHQKKRGDRHSAVGIVHAPSPELAMAYAKEQFARRGDTANLWVVDTRHVMALDYGDEDMFATTPEKIYRDPGGYKVNDKIDAYREKMSHESTQ